MIIKTLLYGTSEKSTFRKRLRKVLLANCGLDVKLDGDEIDEHYDVIIIDATYVPEFLSAMKRFQQTQPQAKILVASSAPTWRRARDALLLGAYDYLKKEISNQELKEIMDELLATIQDGGG